MYCVGLTGTIASGKSSAIHFFKSQGIDTLNADDIAKQLTVKDSHALGKIVDHFGTNFLLASGELNRRLLRQQIMHNAQDHQWLENLLHPLIRKEIQSAIIQTQSVYCVIEIPLLISREPYPYLNRVLLITSNRQEQINRLMSRDQCSEADAITLFNHQEQNDTRAEIADDIVSNNGSIEEFHHHLNRLHQQYLRSAKKV